MGSVRGVVRDPAIRMRWLARVPTYRRALHRVVLQLRIFALWAWLAYDGPHLLLSAVGARICLVHNYALDAGRMHDERLKDCAAPDGQGRYIQGPHG